MPQASAIAMKCIKQFLDDHPDRRMQLILVMDKAQSAELAAVEH